MTVATWILVIATLALAIEGGTALLQWMEHLRPGRTRREIEQVKRQITLLQHASGSTLLPPVKGLARQQGAHDADAGPMEAGYGACRASGVQQHGPVARERSVADGHR